MGRIAAGDSVHLPRYLSVRRIRYRRRELLRCVQRHAWRRRTDRYADHQRRSYGDCRGARLRVVSLRDRGDRHGCR